MRVTLCTLFMRATAVGCFLYAVGCDRTACAVEVRVMTPDWALHALNALPERRCGLGQKPGKATECGQLEKLLNWLGDANAQGAVALEPGFWRASEKLMNSNSAREMHNPANYCRLHAVIG